MIPLNTDLWISQEYLRDPISIPDMISFVKDGGFWTKDKIKKSAKFPRSSLITINRFEDGMMLIHDGHHRATATILGGRNYLREDEYAIWNFKYEDYLSYSVEKSFFTPFNPKTEVRIPNFYEYKKQCFALVHDEEKLKKFIHESKELYSMKRTIRSIYDLAEQNRKDIEYLLTGIPND